MSQIIRRALKILESRMTYETDFFTNPQDTKNYLRLKLGSNEREVFAVLYLSNRNQLISYEELFHGTIDGATVHVREIVKLGLSLNAAAIIIVAKPDKVIDARQRTSDLNLKVARDRAKLLKLEIIQGRDPQAETKKKRNEMTFGTFFQDMYLPYITPRRRSSKAYKQMFDTQLKQTFGSTKVSQITKRQVQEFHDNLRSQGLANGTCNRYLQLIKSSINVGINVMEVIDIKNPAVGIPLFPEEGRERYLDTDELKNLMPVLINADNQIARIARFLLSTGLRLGECLNSRWEHISIDNRVMVIPSASAKSKKTDSIPLNDAAIQVLQECDRSNPYPFANTATGKPYVSIKKGFQKLMKQAGIEGVTAHTLRHTAASMMINAGRSLYDVQKVLRHSSSTVTEKYSHLSQQSVMAASDTISQQLLRAASGGQG